MGLIQTGRGGFNWQARIDTPTLNDMKAKQGAVVSKFMTFMNRKNSVMIELYERAFYNKKPGWDNLANFVYHDLCPNDQLRKSVEDVQFHPVKMIVFIKFKSEEIRDQMVDRLKTGVLWTEYGVSVRGHSLDADVRLIRVLGVSPETSADDIRDTFGQVGVGEVVDLRKGMLDPRRMPGVTNGTWFVRVRILDADKNIPPYIIRREEGELWSLNFEGRKFVCWKCGSPDHIGDKCKDRERTFEEVFGDSDDRDVAAPSWAAVVEGSSGLDEDARAKRDAMAKQIKYSNAVKAREKLEAEEIRLAELEEIERKRNAEKGLRQRVLEEAKQVGQQVSEEMDGFGDSFEGDFVNDTHEGETVDKEQVGEIGSMVDNLIPRLPPLLPRSRTFGNEADDPGGSEDRMVGDGGVQPRLAIEYMEPPEGEGGEGEVVDEEVGKAVSPGSCLRGKKRVNIDDESDEMRDIDIEHDDETDLMALGSSFITDDSDISDTSELSCNQAKKFRLDSSDDFVGTEGEHEHVVAGEVVEETVQVHVVKGYWETIREFWDQQPEIESAKGGRGSDI